MKEVIELLKQNVRSDCALEFEGDPWKLAVMARLSAQCKDERVNLVCRDLFKRYPTAESMANAFPQDMNHTDVNYPYSAMQALNQVRINAGMPEIPQCDYEEFMPRLQNEWRVEFAFEDHRFWDVRRWKMGDQTQRELAAVKILRSEDGQLSYYRQVYETRTWTDRMYLYPIPQTELHKNNNLFPQNTGW